MISLVAGLSPITIFGVISFTNWITALVNCGCVVIPNSFGNGPKQLSLINTLSLGLISEFIPPIRSNDFLIFIFNSSKS